MAMLAATAMLLATAWIGDDAFITLRVNKAPRSKLRGINSAFRAAGFASLRPKGRRIGLEEIKVVFVAIFPALAWMAFSLIYYGAPLPNTAYAKLGTGYSAGMMILQELEYAKDFVLTDPLLALVVSNAIFVAARSRNWPTAPLLNDVTLATRAPLWADGRWDAIWRLLSGRYRWIYEADVYGERK